MSELSPPVTASGATLRGGLIAAIFLMATSAIGPGFITQTATFTARLGSAFAFAILASIIIDFVVQMNIWRITALTGKRASETANDAIPGTGYLLSALVIFGGMVFNVGNIAGSGLGLNAMIAWGYVVFRVAHSLVQALWNKVMVRLYASCCFRWQACA